MESSAQRPPSLQAFSLEDLAPFTREGTFDPRDSPDYRTLYVGRDDVHGALMHLFSRVAVSVKFSMFGYDDDELDAVICGLITSAAVYFQGTLDRSQSGGVHEKAILAAWSAAVRSDFAIGTSATGQIEHTKGGILDGTGHVRGLDELVGLRRGNRHRPARRRQRRQVQGAGQHALDLDEPGRDPPLRHPPRRGARLDPRPPARRRRRAAQTDIPPAPPLEGATP